MYHVSFSSIIITKLRGALTVVWAHLQMGSNRFCKHNKLFFISRSQYWEHMSAAWAVGRAGRLEEPRWQNGSSVQVAEGAR